MGPERAVLERFPLGVDAEVDVGRTAGVVAREDGCNKCEENLGQQELP